MFTDKLDLLSKITIPTSNLENSTLNSSFLTEEQLKNLKDYNIVIEQLNGLHFIALKKDKDVNQLFNFQKKIRSNYEQLDVQNLNDIRHFIDEYQYQHQQEGVTAGEKKFSQFLLHEQYAKELFNGKNDKSKTGSWFGFQNKLLMQYLNPLYQRIQNYCIKINDNDFFSALKQHLNRDEKRDAQYAAQLFITRIEFLLANDLDGSLRKMLEHQFFLKEPNDLEEKILNPMHRLFGKKTGFMGLMGEKKIRSLAADLQQKEQNCQKNVLQIWERLKSRQNSWQKHGRLANRSSDVLAMTAAYLEHLAEELIKEIKSYKNNSKNNESYLRIITNLFEEISQRRQEIANSMFQRLWLRFLLGYEDEISHELDLLKDYGIYFDPEQNKKMKIIKEDAFQEIQKRNDSEKSIDWPLEGTEIPNEISAVINQKSHQYFLQYIKKYGDHVQKDKLSFLQEVPKNDLMIESDTKKNSTIAIPKNLINAVPDTQPKSYEWAKKIRYSYFFQEKCFPIHILNTFSAKLYKLNAAIDKIDIAYYLNLKLSSQYKEILNHLASEQERIKQQRPNFIWRIFSKEAKNTDNMLNTWSTQLTETKNKLQETWLNISKNFSERLTEVVDLTPKIQKSKSTLSHDEFEECSAILKLNNDKQLQAKLPNDQQILNYFVSQIQIWNTYRKVLTNSTELVADIVNIHHLEACCIQYLSDKNQQARHFIQKFCQMLRNEWYPADPKFLSKGFRRFFSLDKTKAEKLDESMMTEYFQNFARLACFKQNPEFKNYLLARSEQHQDLKTYINKTIINQEEQFRNEITNAISAILLNSEVITPALEKEKLKIISISGYSDLSIANVAQELLALMRYAKQEANKINQVYRPVIQQLQNKFQSYVDEKYQGSELIYAELVCALDGNAATEYVFKRLQYLLNTAKISNWDLSIIKDKQLDEKDFTTTDEQLIFDKLMTNSSFKNKLNQLVEEKLLELQKIFEESNQEKFSELDFLRLAEFIEKFGDVFLPKKPSQKERLRILYLKKLLIKNNISEINKYLKWQKQHERTWFDSEEARDLLTELLMDRKYLLSENCNFYMVFGSDKSRCWSPAAQLIADQTNCIQAKELWRLSWLNEILTIPGAWDQFNISTLFVEEERSMHQQNVKELFGIDDEDVKNIKEQNATFPLISFEKFTNFIGDKNLEDSIAFIKQALDNPLSYTTPSSATVMNFIIAILANAELRQSSRVLQVMPEVKNIYQYDMKINQIAIDIVGSIDNNKFTDSQFTQNDIQNLNTCEEAVQLLLNLQKESEITVKQMNAIHIILNSLERCLQNWIDNHGRWENKSLSLPSDHANQEDVQNLPEEAQEPNYENYNQINNLFTFLNNYFLKIKENDGKKDLKAFRDLQTRLDSNQEVIKLFNFPANTNQIFDKKNLFLEKVEKFKYQFEFPAEKLSMNLNELSLDISAKEMTLLLYGLNFKNRLELSSHIAKISKNDQIPGLLALNRLRIALECGSFVLDDLAFFKGYEYFYQLQQYLLSYLADQWTATVVDENFLKECDNKILKEHYLYYQNTLENLFTKCFQKIHQTGAILPLQPVIDEFVPKLTDKFKKITLSDQILQNMKMHAEGLDLNIVQNLNLSKDLKSWDTNFNISPLLENNLKSISVFDMLKLMPTILDFAHENLVFSFWKKQLKKMNEVLHHYAEIFKTTKKNDKLEKLSNLQRLSSLNIFFQNKNIEQIYESLHMNLTKEINKNEINHQRLEFFSKTNKKFYNYINFREELLTQQLDLFILKLAAWKTNDFKKIDEFDVNFVEDLQLLFQLLEVFGSQRHHLRYQLVLTNFLKECQQDALCFNFDYKILLAIPLNLWPKPCQNYLNLMTASKQIDRFQKGVQSYKNLLVKKQFLNIYELTNIQRAQFLYASARTHFMNLMQSVFLNSEKIIKMIHFLYTDMLNKCLVNVSAINNSMFKDLLLLFNSNPDFKAAFEMMLNFEQAVRLMTKKWLFKENYHQISSEQTEKQYVEYLNNVMSFLQNYQLKEHLKDQMYLPIIHLHQQILNEKDIFAFTEKMFSKENQKLKAERLCLLCNCSYQHEVYDLQSYQDCLSNLKTGNLILTDLMRYSEFEDVIYNWLGHFQKLLNQPDPQESSQWIQFKTIQFQQLQQYIYALSLWQSQHLESNLLNKNKNKIKNKINENISYETHKNFMNAQASFLVEYVNNFYENCLQHYPESDIIITKFNQINFDFILGKEKSCDLNKNFQNQHEEVKDKNSKITFKMQSLFSNFLDLDIKYLPNSIDIFMLEINQNSRFVCDEQVFQKIQLKNKNIVEEKKPSLQQELYVLFLKASENWLSKLSYQNFFEDEEQGDERDISDQQQADFLKNITQLYNFSYQFYDFLNAIFQKNGTKIFNSQYDSIIQNFEKFFSDLIRSKSQHSLTNKLIELFYKHFESRIKKIINKYISKVSYPSLEIENAKFLCLGLCQESPPLRKLWKKEFINKLEQYYQKQFSSLEFKRISLLNRNKEVREINTLNFEKFNVCINTLLKDINAQYILSKPNKHPFIIDCMQKFKIFAKTQFNETLIFFDDDDDEIPQLSIVQQEELLKTLQIINQKFPEAGINLLDYFVKYKNILLKCFDKIYARSNLTSRKYVTNIIKSCQLLKKCFDNVQKNFSFKDYLNDFDALDKKLIAIETETEMQTENDIFNENNNFSKEVTANFKLINQAFHSAYADLKAYLAWQSVSQELTKEQALCACSNFNDSIEGYANALQTDILLLREHPQYQSKITLLLHQYANEIQNSQQLGFQVLLNPTAKTFLLRTIPLTNELSIIEYFSEKNLTCVCANLKLLNMLCKELNNQIHSTGEFDQKLFQNMMDYFFELDQWNAPCLMDEQAQENGFLSAYSTKWKKFNFANLICEILNFVHHADMNLHKKLFSKLIIWHDIKLISLDDWKKIQNHLKKQKTIDKFNQEIVHIYPEWKKTEWKKNLKNSRQLMAIEKPFLERTKNSFKLFDNLLNSAPEHYPLHLNFYCQKGFQVWIDFDIVHNINSEESHKNIKNEMPQQKIYFIKNLLTAFFDRKIHMHWIDFYLNKKLLFIKNACDFYKKSQTVSERLLKMIIFDTENILKMNEKFTQLSGFQKKYLSLILHNFSDQMNELRHTVETNLHLLGTTSEKFIELNRKNLQKSCLMPEYKKERKKIFISTGNPLNTLKYNNNNNNNNLKKVPNFVRRKLFIEDDNHEYDHAQQSDQLPESEQSVLEALSLQNSANFEPGLMSQN